MGKKPNRIAVEVAMAILLGGLSVDSALRNMLRHSGVLMRVLRGMVYPKVSEADPFSSALEITRE